MSAATTEMKFLDVTFCDINIQNLMASEHKFFDFYHILENCQKLQAFQPI
jgi:hypothetical protein